MTKPDVSVLMTAYNAIDNYPENLFETILLRLGMVDKLKIQVCVVNDASTDSTQDVLVKIGNIYHEHRGPEFICVPGSNIYVKRHKERQGPAAGYQTAAEMATGRYCILQSVRSWYEAGALAKMVKFLDDNPDIGFVYGKTQYHGAMNTLHIPPPFIKERFMYHFDSLFGYMYRREALDSGCQYVNYLSKNGANIDIADYDFMMQLIHDMGWRGYAMRDTLCLNYYYSGNGQQTELVHRYQHEIDAKFLERWGDVA